MEFQLIQKLTQKPLGQTAHMGGEIHLGVGDDAAVIALADGIAQVLAVDSLIEGDHFNAEWSTPEQVGAKAAHSNLSDIAAMGARPAYALVALVLRGQHDAQWAEAMQQSLGTELAKWGCQVIGGDTTHGSIRMVSVTMVGYSKMENIRYRSGATPGQAICVTGTVGASAAAWHMLSSGQTAPAFCLSRHLNPRCRLDISDAVSSVASAMIDVSDGVGSEVRHICNQSSVGAVIDYKNVPQNNEIIHVEKQLQLAQGACAMSGGEDFELLFTAPQAALDGLTGVDFTVIGRTTDDQNQRDMRLSNGQIVPIPHGWQHLTE